VWNWEGCEEAEAQDAGSLNVGKAYLYSPGVFLVVDVRVVGAPYECGLSLLSRSILSRRM
jgi:hypothetical protein